MVWLLTVLIQIDPSASVSMEWEVVTGGEAACTQQGNDIVESLRERNYRGITFTCEEAPV